MQTANFVADYKMYYTLRDKRDALVEELHAEGVQSVDWDSNL